VPSALSVAFAVAGLVLGLAADRLATRWPEHDEEHPPGRRIDWRTLVTAGTGVIALGLLPERFAGDTVALVVFTAWVASLIVGLGTDLDQRLLPDELTVTAVPLALLFALSGANPLVGTEVLPAIGVAVILPAVLYLPSLPFGGGAFGLGDVKLLVGVGLMLGLSRTIAGVTWGLIVAGIVLAVLLVARRISRRSYVPFGPFLILGALWGILIP
jgi:leader peptidase (prepilin peptidase) / N-methyltransferase